MKRTIMFAAVALLGLAACGTDQPSTSADTEAPATTEAPSAEAPETTERPTTTQRPTTTPAPTTTEAPAVMPTVTDYAIELIVVESQCFGSAGCNVSVVPELSIVGLAADTWDESVSITYQIDGDESGPIIETIEVDPEGMYRQEQSNLSTTSAEVVPTATITLVR